MEELEPDARVVADAEGDLAHVGAHRLAQVGDLVDERHLRGEKRVRRVLDELGRRGVGHEDRSSQASVELGHAHGDAGVLAADDDAVRLEEVTHRGPFAEELWV